MKPSEMDRAKRIEVMFEFLVFGIVVGIVEDVLAVWIVTGEPITFKLVGLVILIALPFAIVGELIADNIDFSRYIRRFLRTSKH